MEAKSTVERALRSEDPSPFIDVGGEVASCHVADSASLELQEHIKRMTRGEMSRHISSDSVLLSEVTRARHHERVRARHTADQLLSVLFTYAGSIEERRL